VDNILVKPKFLDTFPEFGLYVRSSGTGQLEASPVGSLHHESHGADDFDQGQGKDAGSQQHGLTEDLLLGLEPNQDDGLALSEMLNSQIDAFNATQGTTFESMPSWTIMPEPMLGE
jgi:hypothetical protein